VGPCLGNRPLVHLHAGRYILQCSPAAAAACAVACTLRSSAQLLPRSHHGEAVLWPTSHVPFIVTDTDCLGKGGEVQVTSRHICHDNSGIAHHATAPLYLHRACHDHHAVLAWFPAFLRSAHICVHPGQPSSGIYTTCLQHRVSPPMPSLLDPETQLLLATLIFARRSHPMCASCSPSFDHSSHLPTASYAPTRALSD
jgi:hypothetical protein